MQRLNGWRLSGCDGDWIVPGMVKKEEERALWGCDRARDGEKKFVRAL